MTESGLFGTRSAFALNFDQRQRMWEGGWRRYLFPSLWLIYLAQTVSGVFKHSSGIGTVIGCAIVAAFCACYMFGFPYAWTGNTRRFAVLYVLAWLLTAAETLFAHDDAFVFFVYLAVLTMAGVRRHTLPLILAMTAITIFVPSLIPSWHDNIGDDFQAGLTIVLVSFAMYGFFSIIQSNIELAEARAEVARLAAENERSRIARDLHDLLGHSLTTITVKASLARRLAERGDIDRAVREIASVEELSRRSLAEVRAAVSGYREVTLSGELASAREVLHASGVSAELPEALDAVEPRLHALFGWIVREGITNVVRHARATHVVVTVGATWVEITDDGIGGTSGKLGNSVKIGNGLAGLQERVAAQHGDVEVGGCERGWRLRVDMPVTA